MSRLGKAGRWVWQLPAQVLIGIVWVYQKTLSRWMGGQCRFEPTCSRYFVEAVRRHGAVKGGWLGMWRICRCNPFCKGGYDPVPERKGICPPGPAAEKAERKEGD